MQKEQENKSIETIRELLKDLDAMVLSSAVNYDFDMFLKKLNPKPIDVIEIGTHNGLSSALMSFYAKRVFTFDIALRNSEFIWHELGIRNKIRSFVGSKDQIEYEIAYIQKEWSFREVPFEPNFAFVDGGHEYYDIMHDFNLVKFCGRVLFHDYNCCLGVKVFCNEIGAKPIGESQHFAYWEAK